MKNKCAKTRPADNLYKAWRDRYGEAVDGDATVICDRCDATIHGDSPDIVIVCWECYQRGER